MFSDTALQIIIRSTHERMALLISTSDEYETLLATNVMARTELAKREVEVTYNAR